MMEVLSIAGLSRLDVVEMESELGIKARRSKPSRDRKSETFNDITPATVLIDLAPALIPALMAWILMKRARSHTEIDFEYESADGTKKKLRLRQASTSSGGDSAALQEYFRALGAQDK
jgi:hypothetical protein